MSDSSPADSEHCCNSEEKETEHLDCNCFHIRDFPAGNSDYWTRGTLEIEADWTDGAEAGQGRRGTRTLSSWRPEGVEAAQGRLADWSWPLSQIVWSGPRQWRLGSRVGSADGWPGPAGPGTCAAGRPGGWGAGGCCVGSVGRPPAVTGGCDMPEDGHLG